MNARERLELSHWRPETYESLKAAGLDEIEAREDKAIRLVSVAGWIFFIALMGAVIFGG